MPSKTIVSFSTLPSRLAIKDSFIRMLQSMEDQTCQDFDLQLNLPQYSVSEDVEYEVPDWLGDYNVTVHRCEEDWGSHTKIIPTLQRESDPDTQIIIVDDDYVYHKDLIKRIKYFSKQYPDCAIGFDGCDTIDPPSQEHPQRGYFRNIYQTLHPMKVKVLKGFKGVFYLRKFFDDTYYEYARKCWCDDLVISCMMGKAGVEKLVCPYVDDTYEGELTEPYFGTESWNWPIIDALTDYPRSGCNHLRKKQDTRQRRDDTFIEMCELGWYDGNPHTPAAGEFWWNHNWGVREMTKCLTYRPIGVDKFPFFMDEVPTDCVDHSFSRYSDFNAFKALFYRNPSQTVCFWSKDDLK